MTVKEIIKLVCEFVGEREILSKLDDVDATFTDYEQEKLDVLVKCFNLVNQEIATDYIPLLLKEEVSEEKILFSSLSKTLVNVYEVKNRFGMNLKFKLFSDYVEVESVPKSIIYSFLPENLTLNDIVDCNPRINARVYAYGIASEFLLIYGISENAEIWEDRFKTSLFILNKKNGKCVLPKRSWR
ncbi:MAG: hypothetical protein K2K31_00350 [Clostridia bacterium]|nr:hypothetical protein [Clostridia bacterium]